MKTFKLFTFLIALFSISLGNMSFSADQKTEEMALLPDLRVSKIATPGGLCKGNESSVRVTITNPSMAAAKGTISVILYVSQKGGKPSSYVGTISGGLGPNSNYGKPVWFKNVTIPATGEVTLKALVNPDQQIHESVYNNNTKIQKAKVTKQCGQSGPVAQGAELQVTTFVEGEWNYSNYTPVPSVTVRVKKNGQTIAQGVTNHQGKYTFNSIPKGMCQIQVQKNGYTTETHSYNMPTYNAKKNIAM